MTLIDNFKNNYEFQTQLPCEQRKIRISFAGIPAVLLIKALA